MLYKTTDIMKIPRGEKKYIKKLIKRIKNIRLWI